MAIDITQADSRVDYGDMAAIAGLTGISVGFYFQPSANTSSRRLVHQWGFDSAKRSFLVLVNNTDEIAFAVFGNEIFGRETVGLNLVNGTQYRVLVTWITGTPNIIEIWVDGVSQAGLVQFAGNTNQTSLRDGTAAMQLGNETDETAPGEPGAYAELAIWDNKIPDWAAKAYTEGFSPNFYRTGGILYDRLLGTNSFNEWGSDEPTHFQVGNASHPRVITPTGPIILAAAVVVADVTMTADTGIYTITGNVADLPVGRELDTITGTYTIAGQAAALPVAKVIEALQGSYAITGQATDLLITKTIEAVAGSYAISGQTANLLLGRRLDGSAVTGTYAISGNTAGLGSSFTVTADAGSYTVTGNAAELIAAYVMAAVTGTYTITGNAATLTAAEVVSPIGPLLSALVDPARLSALLNPVRVSNMEPN